MNRISIPLLLGAALIAAWPASAVAQVVRIVSHEDCGRIGIAFQRGSAVVVEEVLADSPAERAGIQVGDTLIAVDGEPVTAESLRRIRFEPNVPATLRIRRGGETIERPVVAERSYCTETVVLFDRDGARDDRREVIVAAPSLPRAPFDSLVAQMRREQSELDRLMRRMRADEHRRLDSLRMEIQSRLAQHESRRRELERLALARFRAWRHDAGLPSDTTGVVFRRIIPWVRSDSLRAVGAVGRPATISITPFSLGSRAVAGVEFTEMNPELASYFVDEATDGLLVLQVAPETPGARAGLLPGDVLIRVDGEPVESIRTLRLRIVRAGSGPLRLSVIRRGEERVLEFRPLD